MNVALPETIRLGRDICGDLTQAERREWWLANGRGAYAAGTVAGTLTRRYHGLLIAPLVPPLGRCLVVAKADATLTDGACEWPLFSNRWSGGIVDPRGNVHIESFLLDGRMPVWRYVMGDVRLEMRVWMEPGADTTYVAYRLDPGAAMSGRSLKLRVRLMTNARDHHGNTRAEDYHPDIALENELGEAAHGLVVRHAGGASAYALRFKAHGGRLSPDNTWYENFDLSIERERGLPAQDRHLCVGQADFELTPGEWFGIVASLEEDASPYLEEAMRRFHAREAGLIAEARLRVPEMIEPPPWIQQLILAADSFVFARPLPEVADGESVIAGYPWFGDWGRDTMIALPGLTLATGRCDDARRILQTFARFVDRGMLPNVFPAQGETPAYNTADAALWYFEAWRAYLAVIDDRPALKRVFPVLQDIVAWHVKGTRFGIGVDPQDGLLRAGEPGVQLTWMDAKVGDWVVTPRIGKPVEINALWFNALNIMAELCARLGKSAGDYQAMARKAGEGFRRFIDPGTGALYDVIDGPQGHDASVRPNQIFAVSLAYSPLERATQRAVVGQCGRELMCSYGLRSLAPGHPDYRAQYLGDARERDAAYHQGTAWAWLLGHYALAEYRVTGDAHAAQARLEPIRDHLFDAGLGTVSEIFDGAPPHHPRGAPSQAWSVACVLQAWRQLERAKHDTRTGEKHAVPAPLAGAPAS
ncbi:MAG: amylo-alpha-1,6-glucosidase [Sulfuricaulis sp.]